MRRHAVDPVSLALGVALLLVTAVAVGVGRDGTAGRWLVPAVVAGVGVVGLLGAVLVGLRRDRGGAP